MAKNTAPEAKEALNRFKMEAASEVSVFCIKKFQNALFKSHFRDLKKATVGAYLH